MSKEALHNVLIVGSGGRKHAIGWKFTQSRRIGKLYFAPGNAGTEQLGRNVSIDPEDIHRLAGYVKDNKIDLTFVGPEAPLAKGIKPVSRRRK